MRLGVDQAKGDDRSVWRCFCGFTSSDEPAIAAHLKTAHGLSIANCSCGWHGDSLAELRQHVEENHDPHDR